MSRFLFKSWSASMLAIACGACSMSATAPTTPSRYHAEPWEQDIGYSQAVRVGDRLYVSGTTGDTPANTDVESQMKLAYERIQATLAHFHATLANVVVERVYARDIEALIKCQPTRKRIYGAEVPAATWVEVKRLYTPSTLLEIEVEAVLP